jgi:hypothetical protein
MGIFQGLTAGVRFGYRFGPQMAQIAHFRGRSNSKAPKPLDPIRQQASPGYRHRLTCENVWCARRDSNPQPSDP